MIIGKVDKTQRLEKLEEARKELIPKAKFWNQNSIFLGFAFGSAIMLMTGIEIFRIWVKDYSFKIQNFITMVLDPYFQGIMVFFIFGLFIAIVLGRKIDNNRKDIQRVLEITEREIKILKQES